MFVDVTDEPDSVLVLEEPVADAVDVDDDDEVVELAPPLYGFGVQPVGYVSTATERLNISDPLFLLTAAADVVAEVSDVVAVAASVVLVNSSVATFDADAAGVGGCSGIGAGSALRKGFFVGSRKSLPPVGLAPLFPK